MIVLRLFRLGASILLLPIYGLACLVALTGVTLFWHHTQGRFSEALPPVVVVERVTVTRPDTEVGPGLVTIGRNELGQTDALGTAELSHLAIRFDGALPVALVNVAQTRRLTMTYENGREYVDRDMLLSKGDVFRLASQTFTVLDLSPDRIVLERQDGMRQELPQVYDPAHTTGLWVGWKSTTMLFGGGFDHGPETIRPPDPFDPAFYKGDDPAWAIRVAVPGVEDSTLRLERSGTDWRLRVLKRAFVQICRGGKDCRDPVRQSWPLVSPDDGRMTEVTIGRTSYRVAFDETTLHLVPRKRAHWLSQDRMIDAATLASGVSQVLSSEFRRGIGLPADRSDGLKGAIRKTIAPFLSWAGLGVIAVALARMIASRDTPVFTAVAWPVLLALFCLAAAPTLRIKVPEILAALPWIPEILGVETAFGDPRIVFFCAVGASSAAWLVVRAFSREHWTYPTRRAGLRSVPLPLLCKLVTLGISVCALFLLELTDGGTHSALPDMSVSDGLEVHRMLTATILMYVLVGFLLVMTPGAWLAPPLWTTLTVIVAFGCLSAFQQAFGHRFSPFRELFDMHVLAMAAIALVSGRLTLAGGAVLSESLRSVVRALEGTHFPHRFRSIRGMFSPNLPRIVPGWFVITLFSGVIGVGLFLTAEAGVFGFFQPSELGKTWIALLLALILAARHESEVWRMPFEARLPTFTPFAFFVVVFGLFLAGSGINGDLSPILILVLMTAVSVTVLVVVTLIQAVTYGWLLVLGYLGLTLLLNAERISAANAALAMVAAAVLALLVDRKSDVEVPRNTRMMRARWFARRRGKTPVGRRVDSIERWVRARLWTVRLSVLALPMLLVALLSGWSITLQIWAGFKDVSRLESYDIPLLSATVQDRLVSWVDGSIFRAGPEPAPLIRHPDMLLQVRESREVIAASGCRLSDLAGELAEDLPAILPTALAGVISFAITDSSTKLSETSGICRPGSVLPVDGELPKFVVAVPAVQDDFAATLFISVFGTDGMLALALAQAAFILITLLVASALVTYGMRQKPMRSVSILGAVFLLNTGFILLAQFCLAWSNVFGLLPVVGQPMTFLSFAGSHHLFFALPTVTATLAFALISGAPRLGSDRIRFIAFDAVRVNPAV